MKPLPDDLEVRAIIDGLVQKLLDDGVDMTRFTFIFNVVDHKTKSSHLGMATTDPAKLPNALMESVLTLTGVANRIDKGLPTMGGPSGSLGSTQLH
jgi:hypothetical protein